MNLIYIEHESNGRIQALNQQKKQIRLGRLAKATAKNVEPSTPKRLIVQLFLYLSGLKVKHTPIITTTVERLPAS